MNAAELSGLRYRVCERKVAMGRAAAMSVGARARGEGTRISAYRCPFLLVEWEEHWHVGHAPAMATLVRIAEMLRERSGGASSLVIEGQAG